MRFFQISLLFFILSSCSLSTTRDLVEQSVDNKLVLNNYFSDKKVDYLYKARISIYNKNFGGVLIIKKIGEAHHRIVFTTEMGNKIFDFEIINDDFKVNQINDELNIKMVLKTLESDFQILVKQYINVNKKFNSEFDYVYQSIFKKNNNYYFYKKETKHLSKIISTSKNKEKFIINFAQIKNEIAGNIILEHKNFKLKIDLTLI